MWAHLEAARTFVVRDWSCLPRDSSRDRGRKIMDGKKEERLPIIPRRFFDWPSRPSPHLIAIADEIAHPRRRKLLPPPDAVA